MVKLFHARSLADRLGGIRSLQLQYAVVSVSTFLESWKRTLFIESDVLHESVHAN